MKKSLTLVSVMLCVILIGLLSNAQASRQGIIERIENQQHRINQGINSGALTRSEADILQDNLNYVRDTFNRMKADGRLTPGEEQRLQQILNQNNEMIYHKKHNLQIRRLY